MSPAVDPRLRRFSFWLVGGGFYALFLAGYAGPLMLGGLAALLGLAYYQERFHLPLAGWPRLWNLLLLAALIWLAWDSLFLSQNLVENSLLFTIALQANRLLNAKADKDYLQLALLAFLQLIVSTVFTERVEFILPFLLFLVVGVWVLTLYTVREQVRAACGPDEGERQAARLSREPILSRRFLAAESLLTLALLLATMTVFYAFPRMSFGFFYKKTRNPHALSGFSENITLGSINTIKEHQAVVMRVPLDEPTRRALQVQEESGNSQLYWRGTALDRYDGRSWSQAEPLKLRRFVDGQGLVAAQPRPPGRLLRLEIYLEPSESRTVFGLDKIASIGWSRTFLERVVRRDLGLMEDRNQGLALVSDYSSDRRYIVESVPDLGGGRAGASWPQAPALKAEERRRYLQLPPDLDPRIPALAARVAAGKKQPLEQMAALAAHLRRNFGYTLEVNDRGVADPLAFFLFENQKGHCEYFSTALAILGRTLGIPTRNAVGFLGGDWNAYGQYLAVREADAHSWVEAFSPEAGWQRFDATPPQEGARPGRFSTLNKYYDYLKLRWYKYIVEYDLRTQRQAALAFWETTRATPAAGQQLFALARRLAQEGKSALRRHGPMATALLALLAAAAWLLRRWRQRRRTPQQLRRQQEDHLRRLYNRFLAAAAARGWQRRPEDTYREFAARIAAVDARQGLRALALADLFSRLRFGRKTPGEHDLIAAARGVEQFRQESARR